MSEENKEVQQEVANPLGPKTESISKTMIKKLRAMTKDQLVERLVATSNYAEQQKAASLLLMYQAKQLNEQLQNLRNEIKQLKGETQDVLATETSTDKEVTNENV